MAIIRIDLDHNGISFDFVYVNDALTLLEGIPKERFLDASFYQVFPNGDKKWRLHYWKTAYRGTNQEIADYSPEIDKYLMISYFQPMYGYFGCVLRDVTEYLSRMPFIITTNLTLAELKEPKDISHACIYDCILERCAPVRFSGRNYRTENAENTNAVANAT